MQNKQLNWSEGLFLRPQHFQSADRYWHEIQSLSSSFDSGYNWGVFNFELNEQALGNQILQIVRFQGRTKLGTIISFADSVVDRVDLNEKMESDSKFMEFLRENNGIKVYLGIPHLKLSRPNVAMNTGNGQTRFIADVKQFEDEVAGGNPQQVETRTLNVRFLFESDDLDGYEAIPVFRLIRSREVDGSLKKDSEYYPPCLTVRSFPELQRNVMEAAYDLLNNRAEVLRKQVSSFTFSTQSAGAIDRLLLLQTINEAIGGLNCYSFSEGIHPLDAYTMLCQLVGKLSIFGAERSAGDYPRYDHDDLYSIFQWLLQKIRLLIDLGDEGYFQEYFKGIGRAKLRVGIEPEWFSHQWQLVLGIHSLDVKSSECLALLDRSIAWKLAQPSFVDYCYEKHARGLKLRTLRNLPNVLPKTEGWSYFSITQDDLFDEVKSEGGIGLRLNGDQIENLAELENNQQTIHLDASGQRFRVEFAIFAIRENS
ncbi:MAG: type VI secretion system baseplate subunit TssK [Planctomycetota bacterium]